MGSYGLILLTLNGFSFQYFWPEHPDWSNTALLVQLSLALLAMAQFCRSFLDLRRTLPRLDRVFIGRASESWTESVQSRAAGVLPSME